MKKRLIRIVLLVAFVLAMTTVFSVSAAAADDYSAYGATYSYIIGSNTEYELSDCDSDVTDLKVYSSIFDDKYYTVTGISYSAFYGCTSLESVTIGSSVTTIGESAFYCCSKLTGIVIPDSVTHIGVSAFYACKSLESITVGRGVSSIGSYAFSGCSSIESVNIPDSVTSIGNSAFYNCTSLESVTIGSGITRIGGSAFYKSNITTVRFNGTKAEWNTSLLKTVFNTNYTVHCSDGNITK